MSIVTDLKYSFCFDKGVTMTSIMPAFLCSDEEAHRFIIDCHHSNDSEPVDLAKAGVSAYFIRDDDATIPLNGETDGNTVSVLLPAACYAVTGCFSLVIKLTLGDSISTIFWGQGAVSRSRTDVIIDPESIIPSLDELLARIDAMEKATLAANEAASSVESFKGEINDRIGQLTEAITEPSYNLYAGKISGATIASNGKIGSSTTYDLFYAPVETGKTYSIRLKDTTASTFGGFFESEPGAVGDVSYNAARISISNGAPVTAPITGWMVFREDIGFDQPQINEGITLLPYAGSLTAKDFFARAKLADMDGIETGAMHSTVVPSVTTGAGNYINDTGSKKSNASLNLSDPIDLAPGFTITVKAAGSTYSNSVAIIASVTNDVYTPLVLNSNGKTFSTYTYTAQAAERIVISYLISAGVQVSISGNVMTSINLIGESVSSMDHSVAGTPLQMFTDIVCCGDSLTYSAVFTDAAHHRQAFVPWPTQIQRVTGVPTTMQAKSGMNPRTWYAEYGSTIAQSSEGNRLYITYFGHNASAQYPYTDTFGTDCPENADPSTWADTLTGWWGRIFNDIYAAGCKALIIRVSDSNGYRATQDAIIEDIAARWNVPVIDNPYLADLIYHSATDDYANEAHYNELGYMAFCRQLLTNIGKMSLSDLEHLLPSA